MAASTYLSEATLNWLKGVAYPSPPAALHISVHTGDPGGNGSVGDVTAAVLGGRAQLPQGELGAPSISPGGGRQISNTVVLTLSSSALASAVLTHYGIWDASTAGNFLASGKLELPVAVVIGDVLRFTAGRLIVPVR